MKKFLQNMLSAEGRLNRIGFLHTFIFMLFLFILLSILNREYIRQADGALTLYLYVKSLETILLLALWTPSIIKRLHDMDIKGNRVLIAWAALLLDAHNLMLLNIHIALFLEKNPAAAFSVLCPGIPVLPRPVPGTRQQGNQQLGASAGKLSRSALPCIIAQAC